MTDIDFANSVRFSLDLGALEPTRGTSGSAGWDLHISYRQRLTEVKAGNTPVVLDTGVRVAIPDGAVGLVFPRSSWAVRGLMCNIGVIDSDYRGTIKLILWTNEEESFLLNGGERIAQLVVLPIITSGAISQVLPPTERGEGGLGSTG